MSTETKPQTGDVVKLTRELEGAAPLIVIGTIDSLVLIPEDPAFWDLSLVGEDFMRSSSQGWSIEVMEEESDVTFLQLAIGALAVSDAVRGVENQLVAATKAQAYATLELAEKQHVGNLIHYLEASSEWNSSDLPLWKATKAEVIRLLAADLDLDEPTTVPF